ncbi:MAG: EAL domain-containing protein [Nitriliruptoraceae bacterium]
MSLLEHPSVHAVNDPDALIDGALRMLRAHLGLDVAFVSQLADGLRTFRHVDAVDRSGIEVDGSDPAEESYCHHVAAGRMPEFMVDPKDDPIAGAMAVTSDLPVGTHFSIPLVFSDGATYGTFCGFSHEVLDHLGERDLAVVRMLARLVAGYVEQSEDQRQDREQRRQRLLDLEHGRDFAIWLQPIVGLDTGRWVGFEALARFPDLPGGPAVVFAEAAQLGVGVEVELAAIRAAVTVLPDLPGQSYLAVNAGPDTILDPRLTDLVRVAGAERIVLELTEHVPVQDYPGLQNAIRTLTGLGTRLAIDDVGTGFSGLHHILELEPHMLKLDGVLVRDVNDRPGKQAMVTALTTFARDTGVTVIAEQVETPAELQMLTGLGVHSAQGYLLTRPTPFASLFPRSSGNGSGAHLTVATPPTRKLHEVSH